MTSVKLNATSIIMEVATTQLLTASVAPSDATDKTVTWESSDNQVATVKDGQVTAVSPGTAEITAKAGKVSAKCSVTVVSSAQGVTLDKTEATLEVGESLTLTATVTPEGTTDVLEWYSSATDIATVTDGLVTAVGPGIVTITAKAGSQSATCEVVVNKPFAIEAVDLGLSVKWANANVGATAPEGYGDYFAWGETETKSDYSWETYKFGTDYRGPFSKYNTQSSDGPVDNMTVLDAEDDVAHVKLGGNWRMPTKAELTELINNCTWTVVTNYNGTGINGRLVTATNGNSIFLPASGSWYNTELIDVGSAGGYWSSSLYPVYSCDALSLFFRNEIDLYFSYHEFRYDGRTVRPVLSPAVESISLNKSSLSISVGGTEQLTATVLPSEAASLIVSWVSTNTSVATVSDNGVISAVTEGTATIIASVGSKQSSCTVTVATRIPEAVDLGLSVKWADANLGAAAPEEYGDYYAWGETVTKEDYSWETYKWCNGDYDKLTKYNTSADRGTVDNKVALDAEDDIAHVKVGGNWRMPTASEVDELVSTQDNSSYQWEWKSINGHNGWLVTYLVNSNSIFFPAAGFRRDTGFYNVGSEYGTFYWSSSLRTDGPSAAFSLDFYSSDGIERGASGRKLGLLVRPVTE